MTNADKPAQALLIVLVRANHTLLYIERDHSLSIPVPQLLSTSIRVLVLKFNLILPEE